MIYFPTYHDLFQTYHDLFLTKEKREDNLKQGISTLNMKKLRTNAGDNSTSGSKEVALAAIHNTKYRIPTLKDNGASCSRILADHLQFELTFVEVDDIVNYSDVTKSPNFSITNLELEYSCIFSEYLASEAKRIYEVGKGFHMRIFYFTKILQYQKLMIV